MHEQIAEFLQYWMTLRGAEDLPYRDRIDPLTIPRRLLSKVYLMTFDAERGDIRFTLAGADAVRAHGAELSGTFVADLPNRIGGSREAYAVHVRDLYLTARRLRRPVHSRGTYHWADGRPSVSTERITCPILGRDGQTVEFTGIQIQEAGPVPRHDTISSADEYLIDFVRVLCAPAGAAGVSPAPDRRSE